jgi:hypothetical protein
LGQPIACNLLDCGRAKRPFAEAAAHKERIGDELGVPFPLQAERPEIAEEVVHPDVRRPDPVTHAQSYKGSVILGRALLTGVERKVRNALGRLRVTGGLACSSLFSTWRKRWLSSSSRQPVGGKAGVTAHLRSPNGARCFVALQLSALENHRPEPASVAAGHIVPDLVLSTRL